MEINDITGEIVIAAMKVHTVLGARLIREHLPHYACDMSYKAEGFVSSRKSRSRSFTATSRIENGYRVDLLVEDLVVVETKSVAKLLPLHQAQLLAYLKLSRRPVGLLINFNVPHLREGIKRMVN